MEKYYYISTIVIILIVLGSSKVSGDCNINDYPNSPLMVWNTGVDGSGEESHGHSILSCFYGGFLQIVETGFIPNSAKILVEKLTEMEKGIW